MSYNIMAEQIVLYNSEGFPVAIVRPSIIGASLEEPYLGWLDNFYGPTSMPTKIISSAYTAFMRNI